MPVRTRTEARKRAVVADAVSVRLLHGAAIVNSSLTETASAEIAINTRSGAANAFAGTVMLIPINTRSDGSTLWASQTTTHIYMHRMKRTRGSLTLSHTRAAGP